MFCPKCGSTTVDGARFCSVCGQDLTVAVTAEPVGDSAPVAPAPATPAPEPAAPAPAPEPDFPPPPVFAPPATQPVVPAPAPAPAPVAVVAPAATPQFSGWSKAPLFRRLLASVIDGFIMTPLLIPGVVLMVRDAGSGEASLIGTLLVTIGGMWTALYSYLKDGFKGASLGKRLTGLMVVSLKDGRPAGIGASFLRALILGFIAPIEAIMVLVDPAGQRLGDKLAKTQVITSDEYGRFAPGWVRPGKALAIALLVISVLVGVVGSGFAGYVALAAMGTIGSEQPVEVPNSGASPAATDQPAASDTAGIDAATQVVSGFYTAINDGRMDLVQAALVPELKDQAVAGSFEGWSKSEFEFTRGWIDAGTAFVVGRESVQAYGSGGNGGVKFELTKVDGSWLIKGWTAVDSAQVEGSDTTGSSSGIAGPLGDAVARDLVTRLLEARQKGAANIIRQLATERFLTDNRAAWLDGVDNTAYFTAFKIKSVKISGSTATVTVSETWPDGEGTAVYGLVEQGGNVLVDTWTVK